MNFCKQIAMLVIAWGFCVQSAQAAPAPTTIGKASSGYSVGGTVTGLNGTLVLSSVNLGTLTVTQNGAFAFSTQVPALTAFQVLVAQQPATQTCAVTAGSAKVGTQNISTIGVACKNNPTYALGGTISGLTGSVTLTNNQSTPLALSSNGSFAFPLLYQPGTAYAVSVASQPAGQTCTVTGGSGSQPAAAVASIAVKCVTPTFSVGGTITGLTGTLALSGSTLGNVSATTNGSFVFPIALPTKSAYSVVIATQPSGQTCTVTGGSGTVGLANISNIAVNCLRTPTYTVSAQVTGLNGGSVGLTLNGTAASLLASSNGTATFSAALVSNTAYSVAIYSVPSAQNCTVTSGTGVVNAANVTVGVNCVTKTYTVGGLVSGLTGTVTLSSPNLGIATVAANGTFTFATAVPAMTAYTVTVATPPTGQTCTVANGSATVAYANVTSLLVSCTNTAYFTVGGTVSGLSGTLALLDNGSNSVSVTANGGFAFPQALPKGASYSVTLLSVPKGQTCTVSNATGVVSTGNITSVAVACKGSATYTVGGVVSGLTGTVTLNGTTLGSLTLSANGAFTMPQALPANANYGIAVASQPSGQVCSMINGTGSLGSSNIVSVGVSCAKSAAYSVSASISGLSSGSLGVSLNGTYTALMSSNGILTFAAALPSGSAYAVTVNSQPVNQNCTVTNGSGTISANVTVAVSCVSTLKLYTVGGVLSGATGSVQLGGGGLGSVTAGNGTFVFPLAIVSGTSYSVSVLAAPSGQTCTVANGTGVISANVVAVAINCAATPMFTIAGRVSGLAPGASVTLLDNGADALPVSTNTSFVFKTALARGTSYSVSAGPASTGTACSVQNGSGTATANVTSIVVTCTHGSSWYWFNGANSANSGGNFGTQGSSSAANSPGARLNAATWTDRSGALWVFGGNGTDSSGTQGELSDIWKLNPATGMWSWAGGPSTANNVGNYGTLGGSSGANTPGGRDSAATWTDAAGNLWLYGGSGYDATLADINTTNLGTLSDLWKLTPSTGQWTWMGGAKQGGVRPVYSSAGVATATTTPGSRFGAVSWADTAGNLWLFGGYGLDINASTGALSDLWMYSPATGLWTYVSGPTTVNAAGITGTGASNHPGARYGATAWSDPAGNLWLFGGSGFDTSGSSDALNDLWKYSLATHTWSFVSGSASIDAPGSYGTVGTGSTATTPGARVGAKGWTDGTGNLWLIFGYGIDSSGANGNLNDVWMFSPSTLTWTWKSGSNSINPSGVYGASGKPAAGTPGGRSGASTWTDSNGALWVLGGSGLDSSGTWGELNDLWQFVP